MRQPVKKSTTEKKKTTGEQIKLYSTISPLLWAAFNEVKEFSKKKQDEQLNIKKVKMINRLLEKAKSCWKMNPRWISWICWMRMTCQQIAMLFLQYPNISQPWTSFIVTIFIVINGI